MAKRLQGTARVRRLLRNLPEGMHSEMETALSKGGAALAQAMKARAPRRTGALAEGISWKLLARSLKLRVGLVNTKPGRSSLFYGRIQDLGRRGQTVRVRRRLPTGGIVAYLMKVRPMNPKRFITGRMPDLRNAMQRELQGIWARALRKVTGGGAG